MSAEPPAHVRTRWAAEHVQAVVERGRRSAAITELLYRQMLDAGVSPELAVELIDVGRARGRAAAEAVRA